MKAILSTIRDTLTHAFNRLRNEEIKRNLLQAIPFWIASVITGLVAVGYAYVFLAAEKLALHIYSYNSVLLLVLTPVCFLLSWWLVERFSPYARGSGIPQVMAAIELSTPKTSGVVQKLLSLKVVIVKIMSSLVMVAGGGAIGREGPTIQIAASIFRFINERLPPWIPKIAKRNVLVAGAAAGLAAAFNTPLGGIVFGIEELTKTHFSYFKTALFSSVIIAGLTAQGLLGPYLYLGYPAIAGTSSWIIFVVVLTAVIAGLSGGLMAKMVLIVLKWKAGIKSRPVQIGIIAGCAMVLAGSAILLGPNILGSGKEIMEHTLFTDNKHTEWYVPVLRLVGPLLSFTMGASGGIFAPALGAGAAIGSVVSGWFDLSDANTNLIILTGMVGLLTGVTRSPFTSSILVLEMTDRHSVIFYLILAGMVSSLVAVLVDKHSLYDHLKHQYMHELKPKSKVQGNRSNL